jgi:hypothetical protein
MVGKPVRAGVEVEDGAVVSWAVLLLSIHQVIIV